MAFARQMVCYNFIVKDNMRNKDELPSETWYVIVLRPALYCLFIFLLFWGVLSCSATNHLGKRSKDITPNDFGLAKARTGEVRYQVLLETHRAAVKSGVNVDYTGIDTIKLEIPEKTSPIPLTHYNDFKGCVFVVKNTSKKCYLFERRVEGMPISINKRLIDKGDFRTVEELKQGRYLLIVEDENLWVLQRRGKEYGHTRKDVLLVKNGMAKNTVVMPYDNEYSKPKCTFVTLDKEPLVIKNLSIARDEGCTFLTHVTNIAGADDVRFENVSINTPESPLTDDRGISIYNCTNVTMNNVRIEGTYSHTDHSGYGVFLNNVWNYKSTNMYGKANWGIFGNNNVNVARIEDSKINRFDIHCYGRDISFKNVSFFDLYNQYSSVYGTIQYDKCTFTDFVPVLNGGSYNAFVEHEVVMNDCVFNVTPQKNCIYKASYLNEANNPRNELSEKCLPNVKIHNLVVNLSEGAEEFIIFKSSSGGKKVSSIGGLSKITIDGLTVNSSSENPVKRLMLSNIDIQTNTPVDCQLKNVVVNQPQTKSLFGGSRPNVQLKSNLTVKGGKVQLLNVNGIKE